MLKRALADVVQDSSRNIGVEYTSGKISEDVMAKLSPEGVAMLERGGHVSLGITSVSAIIELTNKLRWRAMWDHQNREYCEVMINIMSVHIPRLLYDSATMDELLIRRYENAEKRAQIQAAHDCLVEELSQKEQIRRGLMGEQLQL